MEVQEVYKMITEVKIPISEVTNEDCMAMMARKPNKYYDLSIVDPPYGIGVNQMNMGSRKTVSPDKRTWDKEVPRDEYFNELFRVSKNETI
jgi:site-specific DNA-methyltransferase (adenine-specific)